MMTGFYCISMYTNILISIPLYIYSNLLVYLSIFIRYTGIYICIPAYFSIHVIASTQYILSTLLISIS